MKCKYCNEEFDENKRGKKREYCRKEECIKKARNEANMKWYAGKMSVLNGVNVRIVEQEKKKIIYSSTDKAISSASNEDFSDVIEIARRLGSVKQEINEALIECSKKHSTFDKYDQDFLHKIENFANQDEVYEDEIVQTVREHIEIRQKRRTVKDKEEILRRLQQGIVKNPNAFVVQFIKDRKNRTYNPRIKDNNKEA